MAYDGYLYKMDAPLVIVCVLIAVMRLLGLGLGIYYNNFALAVACYAVVSAIINGIQYIWLMNLVHKYEKSL